MQESKDTKDLLIEECIRLLSGASKSIISPYEVILKMKFNNITIDDIIDYILNHFKLDKESSNKHFTNIEYLYRLRFNNCKGWINGSYFFSIRIRINYIYNTSKYKLRLLFYNAEDKLIQLIESVYSDKYNEGVMLFKDDDHIFKIKIRKTSLISEKILEQDINNIIIGSMKEEFKYYIREHFLLVYDMLVKTY